MLWKDLIDGRKIHHAADLIAVFDLQADGKTAAEHPAGCIHLPCQNCIADAGGADRLTVQLHGLDDIEPNTVFFCQLLQQCHVARSFAAKGKIITAAEFLGSHLLNQHLFYKHLRRQIFKIAKIRHHNKLKPHPLENAALLLIEGEGKILFLDLGNRVGDRIGKDTGCKFPVLQRTGKHLPVANMYSVEQSQCHRSRSAGIRSDKISHYFQSLISPFHLISTPHIIDRILTICKAICLIIF